MTDQPIASEVVDRYDAQLFAVRRMVRYHTKRARFFKLADKCANGVLLFASTAVVASALHALPTWLATSVGLAIAAVAIIHLVWNPQDCAHRHGELVKCWTALETGFIKSAREITAERLDQLEEKRLTIEATEDAPLRVLDAICHNEQALAQNCPPSEFADIGRWQRWLAHFVDVRADKLRKRGDGHNTNAAASG